MYACRILLDFAKEGNFFIILRASDSKGFSQIVKKNKKIWRLENPNRTVARKYSTQKNRKHEKNEN